ncbi:MAG TPA: S41 family peptidase [Candidatus Elarobacter sp.]
MYRPPALFAAFCLLVLSAPAALPAVAAPALSSAEAGAVVDGVAALVAKDYVVAERRDGVLKRLREARAAKRYDVSDPAVLSARLTEDLLAASSDRHMYVNYDPAAFAGLRATHDTSNDDAHAASVARLHNQGYEELRILDANVRYARISGFHWTDDVTARVVDDAARFLGGGDAVVLDLRGNGGGSGEAVHRLISYFMKSDNQLLMTYRDGITGETFDARVLNDLAAPRMPSMPLYVLIDGGTGSAAEEFAYHVQQFKRGTLVGRTTGGAGNNNTLFPVAPGFVVSISTGTVTHPVSKTNWEGKGVAPDVDVAPATALDEALVRALRSLAAGAAAPRRTAYEWATVGIDARLHPPVVTDDALAAYAGRYGIRSIRVANHALVYQRDGRDPVGLRPLMPDLFAFENTDAVRIRFRRAGGRVAGFDQITPDGQVVPSDRTE